MEMVSMRETYGEELVRLGERYKTITVLDSDVSSSTKTSLFAKEYPERFFNVGVAEADMIDIAAGLALGGLRPVANSFAVFLTLKGIEQIRNVICYNRLPVVLVGSYAGLSDSFDGASHQSVEDIAVMRAMPDMQIVVPADAVELKLVMEQIMTVQGPVYIRICRNPTQVLLREALPFEWGKIQVLKEGSDVTIAACGITVPIAKAAVKRLALEGIVAELLNVSTIKPLDAKTLVRSVRKTRRIVAVEEHSVIGGLGSAVAETLMKEFPVPMAFVGIDDTFTETGGYDELLDKYGISVNAIVRKVRLLNNPDRW